MSYVRIGFAGPVGSGKTTLIEAITRKMADNYNICIVTNDIYTAEDGQYLIEHSGLDPERIISVETGGCPHTAIREDASMNLEAVEQLVNRFEDTDLVFIESGGDNLAATFSPELSDSTIFIISVAEGADIPRKGGPGILKSDLLVVNKVDLALHVHVDLEEMKADTQKMRNKKPYEFIDTYNEQDVDRIINWIKTEVLLEGFQGASD